MTAPARPAGARAGTFNEGNRTRAGALSSNDLAAPARSCARSRDSSTRRLIPGARGGVLSRGIIDGAPLVALVLVLAVLGAACATVAPGSDAIVVRTQDVLANSLELYEQTMALHMGHSREESPSLYAALETVRTKFPKAHRALSDALTAYKARKDPTALHVAVGAFFGEVESLAPEGSPFQTGIRFLRKTWEGGSR